MKYYKILNQEENHRGLQYRTGLNTLQSHETWNPSGECKGGGIYYTDQKHVFGHMYPNCWIREVTLPPDARVYQEPIEGSWKADKIILGERRSTENPLTLKSLLEEGADLEMINFHGETYLAVAICEGKLDLAKVLIQLGADIHTRCKIYNYSLIQNAVYSRQIEMIDFVLSLGVSVNENNPLGMTALMCAIDLEDLALVNALLERGADPNLGDEEGFNPIITAGIQHVNEIIKSLVLYGADINHDHKGHGNITDMMFKDLDDDMVDWLEAHGGKLTLDKRDYGYLFVD